MSLDNLKTELEDTIQGLGFKNEEGNDIFIHTTEQMWRGMYCFTLRKIDSAIQKGSGLKVAVLQEPSVYETSTEGGVKHVGRADVVSKVAKEGHESLQLLIECKGNYEWKHGKQWSDEVWATTRLKRSEVQGRNYCTPLQSSIDNFNPFLISMDFAWIRDKKAADIAIDYIQHLEIEDTAMDFIASYLKADRHGGLIVYGRVAHPLLIQ